MDGEEGDVTTSVITPLRRYVDLRVTVLASMVCLVLAAAVKLPPEYTVEHVAEYVVTASIHGELADPVPPETTGDGAEAKQQLLAVIENVRNILFFFLLGLATLFLMIAGARMLVGGGDPGENEKAKAGLRAAAVGYGLAVLAPVIAALLAYAIPGSGTPTA